MARFIFLFALLISQISVAYGGFGTRIEGDRLLLLADDMLSLIQAGKALKEWKAKIEPKFSGSMPSPVCVDERVESESIGQPKKYPCALEIQNIIPASISKLVGRCSVQDGPNCFNAFLVMNGILPNAEFSSQALMKHVIGKESPICKEKSRDRPPSPGDLIVIIEYEDVILHALTYVMDELVYSKRTMYSDFALFQDGHKTTLFADSFGFSTLDSALSYEGYSVAPECRRPWLDHAKKLSSCNRTVKVYSCKSFEEFIWKDRASIKGLFDQTSLLNRLDYISESLEEISLFGKSASYEDRDSIQSSLAQVKIDLQKMEESSKGNQRWIAKFLSLWEDSVQTQFDLIYPVTPFPEASPILFE